MFVRFVLVWVLLKQCGLCFEIKVSEKSVFVKPGGNLTMKCLTNNRLDSCIFQTPHNILYNFRAFKYDGISYYGDGLEKGECGIQIVYPAEIYSGKYQCSLSQENTTQYYNQEITVVIDDVVHGLRLGIGTWLQGSREQGYSVVATCRIDIDSLADKSNSFTNISWFIDDEEITAGLSEPEMFQNPDKIYTIQQNLTVTTSDYLKTLSCKSHNQNCVLYDSEVINFDFPPINLTYKFELLAMGYGKFYVVAFAHPRPKFYWTVENEKIEEGYSTDKYIVENTTVGKENGYYESTLIVRDLRLNDYKRLFNATAWNREGEASVCMSIPKSGSITKRMLFAVITFLMFVVGGVIALVWKTKIWRPFYQRTAPTVVYKRNELNEYTEPN